jgi:hypothetical protein
LESQAAKLIANLIDTTPLQFSSKDVDNIVAVVLEHDNFECTDKESLRVWVRRRLSASIKMYDATSGDDHSA